MKLVHPLNDKKQYWEDLMFSMRLMLLPYLAVSLLTFSNTGNTDTLTGCLKPNGTLVNLAVGDTQAKPCSAGQTLVSLQVGNNLGRS